MIEYIQSHRIKVVAVLIWIGIFSATQTIMSINDWTIAEVADEFVRILRDTWYGPFAFILLYILRPLVLVPGTILTLMAGMIYGIPLGLILAEVANLLSVSVTYSVARWFLGEMPPVEGRFKQFISFMQHNPFEAVLTMQFLYLSIDLTSALAGWMRLPLRSVLLAFAISGLVGNSIGVIAGSSIKGTVANGDLTIRPEIVAISAVILVLSLFLSTFFRRRISEHHARQQQYAR